MEITKYIMLDLRKIFTNDAIIIPIKPINKKEPSLVKSLFVVAVNTIAPKVPAVMKKTLLYSFQCKLKNRGK